MKISLSNLASIFDPLLVPTWSHFRSQKRTKSQQKSTKNRIKISIDFWIDFLTIFDRSGVHLGGQVGPMLATFSTKMGQRYFPEPSDLPRRCFFLLRCPLDAPPGVLQGPSGTHLASILNGLERIFVPFWVSYWPAFVEISSF